MGLPGSGKTTLITNLIGNRDEVKKLLQDSPSTGILNGIQSVQVDYSKDTASKHAAGFDPDKADTKCRWTKTVFNINSLIEFGRAFKEKKKREMNTEIPAQVIVGELPDEETPDESYLTEDDYSKIRSSLENTHSLYLSDTGGQIEFQELLPLLIAGPAIFIFVFRLDPGGLNVLTKVSYRKGQNEVSNEYESSLTIREFFLQTLASINSMELNTVNDFKTPRMEHFKPCVIIVGTCEDELHEKYNMDHEKVNAKIEDINCEIIAILDKHNYENIIFVLANPKARKYLFTVSNKFDADLPEEEEGGGGKIRSFITDWIRSEPQKRMFEITYPLHYLLASLCLENLDEKVITKEFFASTLKRNRIEIINMDNLLCFLHYNIGQIRHFSKCIGVEDLIFNKPTFLFEAITQLIIMTFLQKGAVHGQLSELEKGIFSDDHMKNIKLPKEITHEQFIQILLKLRIIAPYKDKDQSSKYFIPCILNHLQDGELQTHKMHKVQTLVIEFQCEHCECPKGLFDIIICHIITHEPTSELARWRLDPNEIFRDKVSFKVSVSDDEVNFDKITLQFFSTHLEMVCWSANDSDNFFTKQVCTIARSTLESAINEATKSLSVRITLEWLMKAILYRIVSLFYRSNKYSMPCILKRTQDGELQTHKMLEVQPLVINFQCKHIPKGLFGVLIHYFITHEPTSKLVKWRLDPKDIYRDKVSFKVLVGPDFDDEINFDKVTLQFFSSHLEMAYSPANDGEGFELAINEVCNIARSTLESAINEATKSLRYNPVDMAHTLNFKCKNFKCQKLNLIQLKPGHEPGIPRCGRCKEPSSSAIQSVYHWLGST